MHIHKSWRSISAITLILALTNCATLPDADRWLLDGESVVLVGTNFATLCFHDVVPGSIIVRSTYEVNEPNTVVYEEGRDYTVDYVAGRIARVTGSRIPDFSTNVLYEQKAFDHSKFPGFGNAAFFAYIEYEARGGYAFAEKSDQSEPLTKTAEKLRAGGPFKIVAYGDSITAGGDVSSPKLQFQQRYAEYLAQQFPKAVITVENGATGGDSTVQGLARLEEKVLTRSPDLVLVGFGMNDHNIGSVPVAKFEENLVTIVTKIREKTGADVILYSTFPPNPDWKFGSHRMEEYAAATKRAADRLQCAYADVYGVWSRVLERKDPPSLLGNNINHPNDFGHWLYLQALVAVGTDDETANQ